MRRAVLCGVGALGAAALVAVAPATGAGVSRHTSAPSGNVIVVLRDQHAALPATPGQRAAANRAAESTVLARASLAGVQRFHQYGLISAFSATVTATQSAALAADPAVAAVYPDLLVHQAARP